MIQAINHLRLVVFSYYLHGFYIQPVVFRRISEPFGAKKRDGLVETNWTNIHHRFQGGVSKGKPQCCEFPIPTVATK